jgi:hypothetical protein
MNPLELYEAYSAVYAPQEVDEEERPLPKNKMFRKAANLGRDVVSPATSDEDRQKKYDRSKKIIKTLNKEDVDIFDVVLEFLYVEGYAETLEEAEWMMANIIDEEAIAIVLGEAMSSYDRNRQRAAQRAAARNAARKEGKTGAVPGVGYVSPRSERETYRDSAGVERHTSGARMPKNEEYVDESQYARENPEKYEREQAKKSAPVRGERTPMPPRGDKRREDFEKWYAKNVR